MRPLTKKSEATKAHIRECARELFNKLGVAAVTTHDIARAAGLSPGNLYYHYKNKEEIVRAIFEDVQLLSPDFSQKASAADSSQGFGEFVDFFFGQLRHYRFLFRELTSLVGGDQVLATKWRKAHAQLSSTMRNAAIHWVQLGFMRAFESPADVDAFIDNSWIVLSFTSSYFESRGEKSPARLEKATSRQLAAFLGPYHTARGKKVLDEYFSSQKRAGR